MLEADGHVGDLGMVAGVAEPLGEVVVAGLDTARKTHADLVHALRLRYGLDLFHRGGVACDAGCPLATLTNLRSKYFQLSDIGCFVEGFVDGENY